MAKKDLFYKLSYQEQLEEILEKKTFSADCKNLLLSMLYKINISYNDYETVKKMVDSKKQMMEDILSIINDCEEIKLVNPTSVKMSRFKKKNIMFKVDKKKKKIETEPNEKALLNAIYSLPIEKKVYLDEEHSAIRNSLPFVLENGRNINRAEIIRDFDAWSWNTVFDEIPDIECNLIYQNLQILVGKEFLDDWMRLESAQDSIKMIKDNLSKIFIKRDLEEFLTLIFKLSIIIYCKNNTGEKNRLKEELVWNTKELDKLNDTVKLVKDATDIKTKALMKIEKIDKALNDKKVFERELKKASLKELDDRILTPDDFEIRLRRQRKQMEKQIKDANSILSVKKYMEIKSRVLKENRILTSIDENDKKEDYILQLQKYFIKGIKAKIDLLETKKEAIDLMYIIRYYNFVPYFDKMYIKDLSMIKKKIDEVENKLIDKLIALKAVNQISDNEEFNKTVIKKVFELRMINLENVNIEFTDDNMLLFYDVETFEKSFKIEQKEIKNLKRNKKIKLFI